MKTQTAKRPLRTAGANNVLSLSQAQASTQAMREHAMFKAGVLCGVAVTLLIALAVLLLWVIPTMDAAVETAQGMVS